MIAITGATGQLGQLVISALLKTVPAAGIVALARDPAKAEGLAALGVEVRQADYNDAAALEAAFQGVDKLLLISSSEVGRRLSQHGNVIAAAKRAGVGLLAYTSLLHAADSPLALAGEHVATEALLRGSGLAHTILRNGWYFENYTGNLGAALAHGAILGSAKDGRVSAAARADYADAAAAVLTAAGAPEPVYELAGDRSFSLAELAAEVSRQAGKPVAYRDLPEAEYEAALLGVGLPDWLASLLSNSDAGVARGGLEDNSGTLSRLTGRPTTTLADAVRAALGK
ncbi:SDR family oxidoreductase [Pseudoduganella namucuonensis]|uniref:NAD(P)H dehydrogenase (Quinone) n=1 Tax=Pseudoduganella namucuonensis TaxID=1035707 RepID=A0A1I7K8E8_9BURK|nr:SDR family oxidoreductase [Pseudoduganella namucuonensis]SFU93675.1 NAD(P)H dehydrogenase (quinone) [Pseudoduganella namucuonensis]